MSVADARARRPAPAGTRSDERQQVDARGRVNDQAAEERLVEPVGVLERVDDGEPRLGAEEHRRVAVRQVQIDQQRLARSSLRQRGRDVDRDRGRRRRRPWRR